MFSKLQCNYPNFMQLILLTIVYVHLRCSEVRLMIMFGTVVIVGKITIHLSCSMSLACCK